MRRIAPFLAASVFLLGACTSAGFDSEAESGEPQSGRVSNRGELDEIMVALWGTNDPTQEEADAENRRLQLAVAECMAEKGFEYIPNLNPVPLLVDENWGTTEFVAEYGYGLASGPERGEQSDNENLAILEALSESEQDEWASALWGPSMTQEEYDELTTEEQMAWSQDTGCAGAAERELKIEVQTRFDAASEDEQFSELMEQIDEFYSADPMANEVIAEATSLWVLCMETQGYSGLTSLDEPRNTLQSQYQSLFTDQETGESITPDATELAQFQAFELDVAQADFTCLEATGAEETIRAELHAQQSEFVSEHREALDALLAAYGPSA